MTAAVSVPDRQSEALRAAVRLGELIDARSWGALLEVFTDVVRVDGTAWGGTMVLLPSYAVAAGLRSMLAEMVTRHDPAGAVVTGDRSVTAAVTVAPRGRRPCWRVATSYRCRLAPGDTGWLVAGVVVEPPATVLSLGR